MRFKAEWTEESIFTPNQNIEYLSESWDIHTISIFLGRVDEVVIIIENNPKLYPVHRKKDNVHICVLNKHITLYYKIVNASKVDLLIFWNSHRDPNKLHL